jgi:hypothetical protein
VPARYRRPAWAEGEVNGAMDETIPTSLIERCPRNDCASRDVEGIGETGTLWHCRKCDRPFRLVRLAPRDPTGLVTPGGNVAAFDVLPADAAARQLELLRPD